MTPRWLSESEQHDWRAIISMLNLLPSQFEADLQAKHDLSMSDYEILVRLSEQPERSMRMSDLAEYTKGGESDDLGKNGYVAIALLNEAAKGTDVSRAALLASAAKITSFDAGGMIDRKSTRLNSSHT